MSNINPKKILIMLVLFSMAQMTNAQSQLWGLTNKGGHQFGTIFSLAPGATTLTNQIDLPGVAGQSSNFISLIQGSDGNLYGMTPGGGIFGNGIIFKYDPVADTYVETIHLNTSIGTLPYGSLIRATDNMFYGMTSSGGSNNLGVIFQYDPTNNVYTKMIDLEDATGSQPQGSLMQANNGKLYGMTFAGGAFGSGVLFEFDPVNGTYANLFDFNGADGTFPTGNLMQASDNMLYGMTSSGGGDADGYLDGQQGFGVLFQYDLITSTYSKKIDLSNATGIWPTGSLYQASDGFLYGMTDYGGSIAGGYVNGGHGYGVIFKYETDSNKYTDIINLTSVDGSNPYGAFMQGTDGKLYGMTNSGGVNNVGTIFQFDIASDTYTKKIDLTTSTGSFPQGSLMEASDGKFYGLANHSGNVFSAVVFQYDAFTNTYLDKKHISYSDGSNPQGSFIQANDGKLYGLTSSGGAYGDGVLFQFDPVTKVYIDKIDLTDPTGNYPYGSLMQASDGYLYGLNNFGGANSSGVIFQYDLVNNIYTDIFDLSDATGDYPVGNLIQGSDGMLYGMTSYGGANYSGVIFKFDPINMTYTVVVDLSDETGSYPYGSLVEATNGIMYGMTSFGGANYAGTIFSFDPKSNSYTLLQSLSDQTGDYPSGSFIQATNGNLYGMTSSGGANSAGVILQYNIETNIITVKVDMSDATGDYPNGTLKQALNGNIYGTTSAGGANGAGVVFEFNPQTGIYTDLYNFNFLDGFNPQFGDLIEICTPPDVPVLSASSNPICPGANSTLTITGNLNSATSWQWYTSSCGGTSVGSGVTLIVNPTATTTYYARAEGACVSSTSCESITITVNSNPTPTILGNSSFCVGSSEVLSVSGYASATWNDNSSDLSLTISSAGNYAVTVTDNNGCNGTASKTVTENALPTVSISGTTTNCSSVSLSASGGSSYNWDGGSNATSSSNNFSASGTYNVTVTDANGCTATASQSITVNPTPNVSISGNASGCSSVSITAAGGTSYAWSDGSNVTSANKTFTSSGTYTVSVTNGNGCVGTMSFSVTIFSSPYVSINSIGNACLNDASITLSGTPSGGAFSGNGVNGSSFNPASAGAGTSSIFYTYTDAHGCSASATTNASVFANPIPQITSGVSSICSGTNAVLQVGGNYSSYLWNNGNHTNAITINDSGDFVITVTDAYGCSGSAGQHIAVIPSPTAFIATSNGTAICSGASTELDAGHFDSYLWSNGSTNQFVDVTASGTFSVTITDVDGCTGVANRVITVNANPTPSITASGATSMCQGGSVNLCSNQVFTTYNWGANGASSCITATTTGTYSLTVTDQNGCVGVASQSVSISPSPTVTIASFTNVSCSGMANGTITATAAGGSSPFTYSWNTNPVQTSATVTNLPTGSYSVTVTNAEGCTNSASQTIATSADITAPVITANTAITANTSTGSSTANITLSNPVVTDNCSTPTITKNHPSALYPVGATTVIWTATDAAGNTATSSQNVTVIDNQPPTITPLSPVTATTATGSAFASITLTAPSATDNLGIASKTNNHPSALFPAGVTTVIWTVTDLYGNTSTCAQTVTVTDNQPPVITTKNISVPLANGTCTITPSMVLNSCSDNCGISASSVSPNTFSCSNIGNNTVTVRVTDVNTNVSTALCTVTVIGAIPIRTVTVKPSNNTFTGGDASKIFLGYGSQSVTLNGTCSGGTSFNSTWSGATGLSSYSGLYPTFTSTSPCHPTFTVTTTNNYGCSSTTTQDICVKDARDHHRSNRIVICHHSRRNSNNHSTYTLQAGDISSHICANTGEHSDDNHSDHQPDHIGYHDHQDCDDNNDDNDWQDWDDRKANTTIHLSTENMAMELFPNPTNTSTTLFFISQTTDAYTIRIMDNSGRIVSSKTGTATEGENLIALNLSSLAQGFYLVSLQNNAGTIKTKLIKE